MEFKHGNSIPLLSIDVCSPQQGTFGHLQITHVRGLQNRQLRVAWTTQFRPKDFPVSHFGVPRSQGQSMPTRLMQKGAAIAPLPWHNRCQAGAISHTAPSLLCRGCNRFPRFTSARAFRTERDFQGLHHLTQFAVIVAWNPWDSKSLQRRWCYTNSLISESPMQMLTLRALWKWLELVETKKNDVYSPKHLRLSSTQFDSELLLEFPCPKKGLEKAIRRLKMPQLWHNRASSKPCQRVLVGSSCQPHMEWNP